ncbi:MAG: hypothetical protein CENE_02596 [Candidatus Celerinatantimonas neptuna]|nr:MAG: hypothetical protein CENE_02596 [Candidatus Celerinatantimonas neptuna]
MKLNYLFRSVLLLLGLSYTFTVYAQAERLQGSYTNIDNNGWVMNLTLCPKDKAILDNSIIRQYQVLYKKKHTYIKIRSNGLFLLKVSDQGKLLVPANTFTKQRMTNIAMKKNNRRPCHCNVQSEFY